MFCEWGSLLRNLKFPVPLDTVWIADTNRSRYSLRKTSSYFSVFINDSQAALSHGLPLRDMLTPIPLCLSQVRVIVAGVLRAAIRMLNQTRLHVAPRQCYLQRSQC